MIVERKPEEYEKKICGKLIIVVHFIWIKLLIKKTTTTTATTSTIKHDIENHNRKIDNIPRVEGNPEKDPCHKRGLTFGQF